jgi:methylated-DNA-[protein]-cysteine S-methyltransferase
VPSTSPRWWRQTTPVGDALVVVNARGVRTLTLGSASALPPLDDEPERDERIAAELDEYFAGRRRTFTITADLSYVDPEHFGRRVLEALAREVPWGETVTYGELADMVGAPRAARAVGNVMAHNPVQLLLPCHRVVSATGIGGYGSAGVEMKRALLAVEGVHIS